MPIAVPRYRCFERDGPNRYSIPRVGRSKNRNMIAPARLAAGTPTMISTRLAIAPDGASEWMIRPNADSTRTWVK